MTKKKPPVREDDTIDRHCKHMDIVCSVQNALMKINVEFVYDEAEAFILALRSQGYEIREIR